MSIFKKHHLIIIFLLFLSFSAKTQKIENFIIYYSDKAAESKFNEYSLVVFDSEYHPTFKALKEDGITVLGYISLGEIEKSRWYYKLFSCGDFILQENPNWPGSYFIDIRNKKWIKIVIEELIPWILQKKFDGIFIDTLDNAIYLESIDPVRYKGMKQAAVHLVKAIRLNYPQIKIMLNRAYNLLPKLENCIDFELGEGICTEYDFKTKKYYYIPEEEYMHQVDLLHKAMKQDPKLKVFSLDYWNPKEPNTIKKIYQTEYKNNFIPYVSDIILNKIIPEP